MATDQTDVALRAELGRVDEEIATLQRAAAELRRQIGERSDGATDPAETAAAIERAEEQEALVALMEARRERLRRRLGEG
jgi:hypothetical protein